jgi:hypothetical protein
MHKTYHYASLAVRAVVDGSETDATEEIREIVKALEGIVGDGNVEIKQSGPVRVKLEGLKDE